MVNARYTRNRSWYKSAKCALAGFLWIGPANALCMDHDMMVKSLATGRYQERLAAVALTVKGNVMEIFVGESGTFTITITGQDGVSCFAMSGTDLEFIEVLKGAPL